MAIVDFQSLDTRCVVGTQTLTAQFDECMGSDDYLSESGIVSHKGTLTLTEIPGGLGLDDWAGIAWLKIGTPITLEINIAGTWYRHPRGSLRIMGTNYKDGVQSLEVACILGARAFSEPTDELAITATNARAIADQLFSLAGCGTPNWNTSANFELGDRPRLSGSYIESAGKLLASMGCFAWTDGYGVVQIHPLESATVLLTLDEAELGDGLERVLVGKPPASVAKVSGSYAERGDRGTSNTSLITTFGNVGAIVPDAGGYGPVSRTAITESISAEDSTVVLTTQEDRLGFQVYKGKNGLPRASLTPHQFTINTKTFSPGPDAKLLEIVESVLAPTYPTLQGFCDWAIANKFGVSLSNQMSARQSRTRFTYSDKEELIEVVTEVIGPIGKPLSSLSGVDWEKAQSAYGVPSDPILVERQLTQYQQVAPGEWRKVEIREYSQVQDSDSQAGLQERLGEATADGDILQIYRDAAACSASESKITTSTSGQANPPAPERFPGTKGEAKQHQESIPYQGFATDWAAKEQAYTVPYCPSVAPGDPPPRDHIRGYGERWHGAAIARWRSGRIEIPLSTALLAYRPYARVQIATPTGTYLMAMNGTSWAISPDRSLASSDCSFLGQIVNGQLVPPFMPIPDARFRLAFRLTAEAIAPEIVPAIAAFRLAFKLPTTTMSQAAFRLAFRLPASTQNAARFRLGFRLPAQTISQAAFRLAFKLPAIEPDDEARFRLAFRLTAETVNSAAFRLAFRLTAAPVTPAWVEEVEAWEARVIAKGSSVSAASKAAVIAALEALYASAFNSKIDLLHVYAGIETFAGLPCPVRHPANTDATLTNFDGSNYTASGANCGLQGTTYSSVNHNYSIGSLHSGFDFSMGAFVRGAGSNSSYGSIMGTADVGSRSCGIQWRNDGVARCHIFEYFPNGVDLRSFSSSPADLLLVGSSVSSSDLKLYTDSTQVASITATRTLDSTGLGSLRSFDWPTYSGQSNRRFVLSFAGSGLTASEVSEFNTIVQNLVTALSV